MAQSTKRSAANPYRTGGSSRYLQTRGGTSSIPVTGTRSGSKVSVGGGAGGVPAAKGASATDFKVPTGVEPGEPSAPEYNPIIDAETMSPPTDPNRQEMIASQARAPRFSIGNPNVGNIDLGSLLSAKPTEGFDPNAPIGGANVPFQETKGVGGFFRRLLGDTANEQNIAAQQAQGAEWKAEKAEALKEERLLKRMAEADKGPAAREAARLKYMQDKDIRDEIAREDAINLALAREGEKDILSDIDMARKEAADAQERALKTRELDIREAAIKPPRFSPIGNTGLFQTPEGDLGVFEPGTPSFGTMKGTAPRIRMMTGAGAKAPANTSGGSMVDRITGATLGGPLPTTSAAAPKAAAPTRPSLMNMIGAGAENVAGALGLEGLSDVPAALGDLLTPDSQTLEKTARSRARYLNPSMQRTY